MPFTTRKKALLAAVNLYPPDSGLAPLKYAEADATAMDKLLQGQCFETVLLCGPQATRNAIETALIQSTKETGGLFLFYFAGHGQMLRGSSLHLHPVDSYRTGVGALTFDHFYRTWQSEFGYERVLAVLDACRSELGGARGPVPLSSEAARDIRAATRGQRQVEVLYGCSEGEVSFEDDGLRHGVFTNCMLHAFQAHPQYLDTDLLAGATADLMDDWSHKDPLQRRQRVQRYAEPTLKRKVVLLGDPELAAWSKAEEKNSIESYQAYLGEYPAGIHAQAAQAAIRNLQEAAAWAKAKAENTLEACEKFLGEWPQGRLTAEAKQRAAQLVAEEAEWQATFQADTLDRYRAFLIAHAGSRHARAATRRIQEIAADDQTWAAAQAAQTLAAVEDYLARTREERHREAALAWKRAFQDDAAWASASQARELASVRDYQVTYGAAARHLTEAGELRQVLEAEARAQAQAARQAEEARLAEARQREELARRRQHGRQRRVFATVALLLVIAAAIFGWYQTHRAERQRLEQLAQQAERQRQADAELEAERQRRAASDQRLKESQAALAGLNERIAGLTNQINQTTTNPQALQTALDEKKVLEAKVKKLTEQAAQPKPDSLSPQLGAPQLLDLGGGETLELCRLPPGEFLMGSPASEAGRQDDEAPQTQVTISKVFSMGKHEVTQGQYAAVMGANPSSFKGSTKLPVENVSWGEATEFCAKLTAQERQAGRLPVGQVYRLPTEAEWEYACRAGTTTRFGFGDGPQDSELGKYGWYSGTSGSQTHPVGAKAPNAWGLYDMHGNVWERCLDWNGPYPGGSVTDPQGPSTGSSRVIRGGSWSSNASVCRSAYRGSSGLPSDRSSGIGFRVVLAPGQP